MRKLSDIVKSGGASLIRYGCLNKIGSSCINISPKRCNNCIGMTLQFDPHIQPSAEALLAQGFRLASIKVSHRKQNLVNRQMYEGYWDVCIAFRQGYPVEIFDKLSSKFVRYNQNGNFKCDGVAALKYSGMYDVSEQILNNMRCTYTERRDFNLNNQHILSGRVLLRVVRAADETLLRWLGRVNQSGDGAVWQLAGYFDLR